LNLFCDAIGGTLDAGQTRPPLVERRVPRHDVISAQIRACSRRPDPKNQLSALLRRQIEPLCQRIFRIDACAEAQMMIPWP